jgi:hypothetical protein
MPRLAQIALFLAITTPAMAEGDNPPPALLAKIQIATQASSATDLRTINTSTVQAMADPRR